MWLGALGTMTKDTSTEQDLTVKGESVEQMYGRYIAQRYVVNRRYQRKLIWTLEEKANFIDSILNGYPVPIILLAEGRIGDGSSVEIIDGMQRLNAIASFIENDYPVHGEYFDLNTMAVTKALLDSGKLGQKTPAMAREKCVRIASYPVPFSIYEFSNAASVDEVFRRINSGGRKLSRQELRAAGATGHFAHAVRKIAAKIRGDDSASDVLILNNMKKISITNRDLHYGIDVDSIFWVRQSVLTKEQVRESRDEELIADMVAYMVGDEPPSSRAEFLDDFFSPGTDDASRRRYAEIEAAVQRRGAELVIADFQRAFDALELVLAAAGRTFGELLFDSQPARAPRYFQAVFLAFYDLIVRQSQEVTDADGLIKKMENGAKAINVPEGGRWGAEQRQDTVNGLVGVYKKAFAKATAIDPAIVHWITQLQNILSQSLTEQSSYDFKQGFLRLTEKPSFDEDSFEKILQTCVGIANLGKDVRGYVLVGIAETPETAARIKKLFAIKEISYQGFYITGVEHEAIADGKTLDQFFKYIVDKVSASPMSEPLRDFISRNIWCVRYYDKAVFVFQVEGQAEPSSYNGEFFIRRGSQLEVVPATEFASLFKRFLG